MVVVTILKIQKCNISATVWPIFNKFGTMIQNCKIGLLTVHMIKNFKLQRSKTAGRQLPYWKPLDCDISATIRLIKFGRMMQNPADVKISRI